MVGFHGSSAGSHSGVATRDATKVGASVMKRQILFLFAFLSWLGCSENTPTNGGEAGQPLRVEWKEGDVIVAMGTSLTFGYGSGCRVLPPERPPRERAGLGAQSERRQRRLGQELAL